MAGNGEAAKRSLREALRFGRLRYRVVSFDRFGRSIVMAWAGSVNLSCWQLNQSAATYKPKWDNGGLVARECR